MFGIAARTNVEIGCIPQDAGSLRGRVLIVRRQLLEAVEGLLIDQEALLDPAFNSAGGAYSHKTLFAFQHLDALSVLHVAHAVVDRCYLIAQRGLRGVHVRYIFFSRQRTLSGLL